MKLNMAGAIGTLMLSTMLLTGCAQVNKVANGVKEGINDAKTEQTSSKKESSSSATSTKSSSKLTSKEINDNKHAVNKDRADLSKVQSDFEGNTKRLSKMKLNAHSTINASLALKALGQNTMQVTLNGKFPKGTGITLNVKSVSKNIKGEMLTMPQSVKTTGKESEVFTVGNLPEGKYKVDLDFSQSGFSSDEAYKTFGFNGKNATVNVNEPSIQIGDMKY